MASIKIRIGVVADPNIRNAYRPLEEASRRAAAAVARDRARGQRSTEQALRGEERAAVTAARAQERAAAQVARAKERAALMQQRAEEKAAKASIREAERSAREVERIAERTARRRTQIEARESRERTRTQREAARAAERAEGERQQRSDRFKEKVRNPIREGAGMAKRAAEAAGVDFGVGSAITRSINTRAALRDAVNSNAIARGTPATEADMASATARVHEVGKSRSVGYGDLAEGVKRFTAISGDMKTAMGVLEEAAIVAQATGARADDIMAAAGSLAKEIPGDGPQKVEALGKQLRVLAAQGGRGSIELADLARVLGRAASGAGKFAGTAEDSLSSIGAAIQFSGSRAGGRSTPEEAATSAKALIATLTQESTIKNLAAHGVNPFADEGRTKLRSLDAITTDIIKASGGDLSKVSSMIRNQEAQAPLNHLLSVYNDAGGGDAGVQAVSDAWKTQKGSPDRAFFLKQADETKKDAGPVAANNALEELGETIRGKLLPAITALVPKLQQAVDFISKLVNFAGESPKTAIAVGIGAMFAKASVEAAFTAGIRSVFDRVSGAAAVPGAVPGAAPGGGGAKAGLGPGAVPAVAAAGAGGFMLGKALSDHFNDSSERTNAGNLTDSLETGNLLSLANGGSTDPKVLAAMKAKKARTQRRLEAVDTRFDAGNLVSDFVGGATFGMFGSSTDRRMQVGRDAQQSDKLKEDNAKLEAAIARMATRMGSVADALTGGVLQVNVVNQPQVGRDGPPSGVVWPWE